MLFCIYVICIRPIAVNDLSMLSLKVATVVSLNYRYRQKYKNLTKEHAMNERNKLILNKTNEKYK